jgi:hypothetical protein
MNAVSMRVRKSERRERIEWKSSGSIGRPHSIPLSLRFPPSSHLHSLARSICWFFQGQRFFFFLSQLRSIFKRTKTTDSFSGREGTSRLKKKRRFLNRIPFFIEIGTIQCTVHCWMYQGAPLHTHIHTQPLSPQTRTGRKRILCVFRGR